MPRDLILASASRYRRDLLARLGLPFRCVDPGVDEDAFKRRIADPAVLALRLAVAKAEAASAAFPESVVIGSDQLATIDCEVLGKPGTAEKALVQLERLAGRTHELVTAVCILRNARGARRVHVDHTRLTMRTLNRDELARYVALDAPTDCAGSYKIEAGGIALFERVETEDFTAITGLPLIAVTRMLNDFGFPIP